MKTIKELEAEYRKPQSGREKLMVHVEIDTLKDVLKLINKWAFTRYINMDYVKELKARITG